MGVGNRLSINKENLLKRIGQEAKTAYIKPYPFWIAKIILLLLNLTYNYICIEQQRDGEMMGMRGRRRAGKEMSTDCKTNIESKTHIYYQSLLDLTN